MYLLIKEISCPCCIPLAFAMNILIVFIVLNPSSDVIKSTCYGYPGTFEYKNLLLFYATFIN